MKKKERIFAIIFILLFFKIGDTGFRLMTEPFKDKSGLWNHWTAPNAGDSLVVPQETNEIQNLLVAGEIEDFFLSPEIVKNSLIYQRTIEVSFPRRLKNGSPNYFFLNTEAVASHCQILTRKSLVSLARCR